MPEVQPIKGRFVHAGPRRVHYLEAGPTEARTVVLVHGLAGIGQEIFTPLAEPLVRAGYRVIAPDRAGYGYSGRAPSDLMGPRAQSRRLSAALDALGARRPLIVAHSAGAAVAVALACDPRLSVAGLVLISPFARPTRPAAAPLLRLARAPVIGGAFRRRVLRNLAPAIGPRMVRAGLKPQRAKPNPAAFPWRWMAQDSAVTAMGDELLGFNADMARTRTAMRRTLTPTVILAGEGDHVIDTPGHVRWLAHRLPNAQVRWIAGQGHLLHHLAPDAVVQAVRDVDQADRAHASDIPRGSS